MVDQETEGKIWWAIRSGIAMNFSIMKSAVEATRYEESSLHENELARKITDRVLQVLNDND